MPGFSPQDQNVREMGSWDKNRGSRPKPQECRPRRGSETTGPFFHGFQERLKTIASFTRHSLTGI